MRTMWLTALAAMTYGCEGSRAIEDQWAANPTRLVLLGAVVAAVSPAGREDQVPAEQGGDIVFVPHDSVVFALRDGHARLENVNMRSPDVEHVLVAEDEVDVARARGYWLMTASELEALDQR